MIALAVALALAGVAVMALGAALQIGLQLRGAQERAVQAENALQLAAAQLLAAERRHSEDRASWASAAAEERRLTAERADEREGQLLNALLAATEKPPVVAMGPLPQEPPMSAEEQEARAQRAAEIDRQLERLTGLAAGANGLIVEPDVIADGP